MKFFRNLMLIGCAAVLLNSCGKGDERHNTQYRQNLNLLICSNESQRFLIDNDGDEIFPELKIDTATQRLSLGFPCDNNLSVSLLINLNDKTKEFRYIDEDGDVVLDINKKFGNKYKCSGFSEGIAFISLKNDDSKVKAINEDGDILFEFEGTPFAPYFNGVTVFRASNNKYGIMNNKGQIVVPAENNIALSSENYLYGMIEYYKDGKWGMKDLNNKVVMNPQFDEIPFAVSENRFILEDSLCVVDLAGKTIVESGKYSKIIRDGDLLKFKEGDKSGWMDFDGKVVIAPDKAYNSCETLFYGDKWAPVEIDGKYMFIDRTGKNVLESKYRIALPFFNDENCAVILSGDNFKNYEYSLMNRKGELVGDPFKGLNTSSIKRAMMSYVKNWTRL